MKNIVFQALADAARNSEPVTLGIISGVNGSSPQKIGAKALFYSDGRIKGTLCGKTLTGGFRGARILSNTHVKTLRSNHFGLLIIACCCVCGMNIRNFVCAEGWAPTGAPGMQNWWSLALSADGTTMIAGGTGPNGGIYISTNSGVTWKSNNVPNNVVSGSGMSAIACSSSAGQLLVASGGNGVFTSTNLGFTWVQCRPEHCESVASSADGSTVLASAAQRLFSSTNSGAKWTTNTPAALSPWHLAISADGKKAVAADYGGSIFLSTNSGVSWVQSSAPSEYWRWVTSSDDGTRLAAAGWDGATILGVLYVSTNSGGSWFAPNVPADNWWSIATSPDGRRLLAGYQIGGGNGHFYVSANSGNTWSPLAMPTNAPKSWDEPIVAASSAGFAAAFSISLAGAPADAPVYLYNWPPLPSPELTIALTNLSRIGQSSIALSWPWWATNFALQQNLDIKTSNWGPVTNRTTLFSNQLTQASFYQVIIPATNNSCFYRLQIP
jgi:hypothetical protein